MVTTTGTNLLLTFKTAQVTIGSGATAVLYNIPFHESINFGTTTTLNGQIVTPEPNARLLLGLGSIGLMALTLASRKMITN
jgi:hypothetical protein